MASPTDIRKGRVINYQGAPHLVLEMLHRTQGRQAGFVQTTLRNLQSGSTTTTKFRSTDNVDFMHTENRRLEYSYADGDGHHFLDPPASSRGSPISSSRRRATTSSSSTTSRSRSSFPPPSRWR